MQALLWARGLTSASGGPSWRVWRARASGRLRVALPCPASARDAPAIRKIGPARMTDRFRAEMGVRRQIPRTPAVWDEPLLLCSSRGASPLLYATKVVDGW